MALPHIFATKGDRKLTATVWLVVAWIPLLILANLPVASAVAMTAGVLQTVAVLGFILLHASLALGWRGTAAFLTVGYAVGFAFEALSINTGVPFGWFVHHAPSPKPLGVPLYVPLGYAFLSWPAWTLACLLGRDHPARPGGAAAWTVPLLGALILVGYDLAYDAIGSAVKGMWSYRHPSGFFGVPISNFVGWFITGWVIFSLFAFIEPSYASRRTRATEQRSYWLLPCIVWGSMTVQYPLLQLAAPTGEVLVGGRRFIIADIHEAATIVAMLTMLPAAIAAAARALLIDKAPASPD